MRTCRLDLEREGAPVPAVLAWDDGAGDLAPASLHPDEQAEARRLSVPSRSRDFVLGRSAARAALSTRLAALPPGLRIEAGCFGQPVVRGAGTAGTRVGIAHSGGWAAAIAFDEAHPMGIDIERIDPARCGAALRQATAGERALLMGLPLPETERAMLLWTAQESLAKTLTTGLMAPQHIYEVEQVIADDGYLVAYFAHMRQYRAVCFSLGPDMLCAVTLPRRTRWLTPLHRFAP